MRTFTMIAGVIAASAMAGVTYAQFPTPSPERVARERQAQQLRQQFEERFTEQKRQARTACALPDESSHPVNAEVTYEGQRYRCVEVFAPTNPVSDPGVSEPMSVSIAGWIKVQAR
jgi:hypothetical protein